MKEQKENICIVAVAKPKSINISVPICKCGNNEVFVGSLNCTKCGIKSDWFEFVLPEDNTVTIRV